MQTSSRPSPRLTLPQNLLTSAAQAPSIAWTAAATRSLRLGCWADRPEDVQTNANTATETVVATFVMLFMINLPFHEKQLKDIGRSPENAPREFTA
jgi:hypothetical protein